MMRNILIVLQAVCCLALEAQQSLPQGIVRPARQVPVHDPVMIKEKNIYYLFCTGPGITVWSSKDLKEWKKEAPIFAAAPQWAVDTIPGFTGHIWAPDISYHNGQYYLYYSVSAFGKNTSAIGVATNKTLNPAEHDFKWIDHGSVIQSYPHVTNWNAIDPNLITDNKGDAYLVFGSFWEGIKMVKLQSDLLQPDASSFSLPTLASRKPTTAGSKGSTAVNAGSNAIEAPFIFKKNRFYYLFCSIDYCCRAEKSTYKVIVGRSTAVQGPYLDKEGKPLDSGGGTLVLQGNKDWYGAGHNAVYTADGQDYFICHAYDAADGGKSKLVIRRLGWDANGWPVIGKDF